MFNIPQPLESVLHPYFRLSARPLHNAFCGLAGPMKPPSAGIASRWRHRHRISPWGFSWGGGLHIRHTAFFALRNSGNALLSNRNLFQMRPPCLERNLVGLVDAAPVPTLLHTPAVFRRHNVRAVAHGQVNLHISPAASARLWLPAIMTFLMLMSACHVSPIHGGARW